MEYVKPELEIILTDINDVLTGSMDDAKDNVGKWEWGNPEDWSNPT